MDNLKKILVTGANKGIGLAIVKELLESFSDTFVYLGCRDEKKGHAALDHLLMDQAGWSDRICSLVIDVSQEESIRLAASQVRNEQAKDNSFLYGIVNNAGVAHSEDGVATILDVNTLGPKRVFDEFVGLLAPAGGRVVNVTSASGPNYLSRCEERTREILSNQRVNWDQIFALIKRFVQEFGQASETKKAQFYSDVYGFSKACTNALTMSLAKLYPNLIINSCTPGFIETDLTIPFATAQGKTPKEMGMKQPRDGAASSIFLLMDDKVGSGFYFGSDCIRSPLDRYRSPGDPPYQGD